MPQFELDRGGKESAAKFKALDSFTQGYIEAMFFTECDSDDLGEISLDDLSPEAWEKIIEDCTSFQETVPVTLEQAYGHATIAYDAERAGNDFWYTRNGHGAGFWDRGFGDLRTQTIGGKLSDHAKAYGSCNLYRGDDGKLYL